MYFLKLATELGPEGFTIILHHPVRVLPANFEWMLTVPAGPRQD